MPKIADSLNPEVRHMRRALVLAAKGEGFTSPNPMVGAVVVKRGKIIGEGWHHKAGEPHAEVLAIQDAKSKGHDITGATIYVTLEPCAHYHRTPPCVNLIAKEKLAKVVVAMADPNPEVSGHGIRWLRERGIEVTIGLLEEKAFHLNEPFVMRMLFGRPMVTLKAAISLDGRIATKSGDSKWISSLASRKYVHRLRGKSDAILVGIGTVLADDPQLTCRLVVNCKRQPLRVIVDSQIKIPLNAKVISEGLKGQTLIAVTSKAPLEKRKKIEEMGVEIIVADGTDGRVDLKSLLKILYEKGLNSVLLEGGSALMTSMLAENLVDKVLLVLAPILIGGKDSLPLIGGKGFEKVSDAIHLQKVHFRRFGDDLLVEGYLNQELYNCLPA